MIKPGGSCGYARSFILLEFKTPILIQSRLSKPKCCEKVSTSFQFTQPKCTKKPEPSLSEFLTIMKVNRCKFMSDEQLVCEDEEMWTGLCVQFENIQHRKIPV
jgi:hypothetical protein